MRNRQFVPLLASTMLAAMAVVPTFVIAAPDRIETARPLPPALNNQTPHPRETAPVPPPVDYAPPAVIAPQPRAQAPAAPQQPDSGSNAPVTGTPDKIVVSGDSQLVGKLREIVTGKQLEKRVAGAPERKAIEAFYAARNYAPLWTQDEKLTPSAQSAIARLKNAEADGLDAADYPVPDFAGLSGADALADGDIKLTSALLTFARHLATGRIAPARVVAEVDYGNHTPEPADILKKLAEASDAGTAIERFNPPHKEFRVLKEKLAELRRAPVQPDNRIADGPVIKPGAKDARVPALREKLGLAGKPDDLSYDKALLIAVKKVQDRIEVKPTGLIDGKTLAAINGPRPGQQIERVAANMERWRWLPRELGRTYVMVNIPDFTLKVVREQNPVWRTKIVAGKPQTPTPLTSAPMDHIIVNPSWYVPQSIIQNELLPAYASDPQIFDRMGLEVKRGTDGNINVVQPPGAANALGRIKFAFPNKFQVYLHDTPEKRLFGHERRAFSHGCMRVLDPTKFGEVMLGLTMNGQTPNAQQINAMFDRDERTFQLVNKPMVHLTYQTAFVDDGRLELRDDVYGLDARMHAILHGAERRIADVAPPQDAKQGSKRELATARSNQEMLRRVEQRGSFNPFSIFNEIIH
ncbi:MAG: L,D-transpeptidase family protein [Rhizobiales bacterium]|nr:L,D-transpeptidase family protein [Hyphomicrobiales bacterium]